MIFMVLEGAHEASSLISLNVEAFPADAAERLEWPRSGLAACSVISMMGAAVREHARL